MKTVKMKFHADMYYGNQDVPLYRAGEVYEISDEGRGMIDRWLKRGGVIVEEGSSAKKVEEVQAPVDSEPQEPVEGEQEKAEDEAKSEPEDEAESKSRKTRKSRK